MIYRTAVLVVALVPMVWLGLYYVGLGVRAVYRRVK
jgi:hypothetical protein